jgi:hypothetical protein
MSFGDVKRIVLRPAARTPGLHDPSSSSLVVSAEDELQLALAYH